MRTVLVVDFRFSMTDFREDVCFLVLKIEKEIFVIPVLLLLTWFALLWFEALLQQCGFNFAGFLWHALSHRHRLYGRQEAELYHPCFLRQRIIWGLRNLVP